jgi:hypothetical protein
MNRVNRFSNWLALKITDAVSTMLCAVLFSILALFGLPQALRPGGIGFIQWLSTAFLQLVLLSIIMLGQRLQADTTIKHVSKTHADHMWELHKLHVKIDKIHDHLKSEPEEEE